MKKVICILCLFFSINLFATDVYIGGVMTTDGFDKIPAYWHNGQLKKFFVGATYRNDFDYVCMAVENGKVYVCLTNGETTYIYSNETLLYQIDKKSKPKNSTMLVLNGNVFLCIGGLMFRNGELVSTEWSCNGLALYNGYICYDMYSISNYRDNSYPYNYHDYSYYKGYCVAGNTYKSNSSNYWLSGERAYMSGSRVPDVKHHAMKVYNSNIYVLCSYQGHEMKLLKNNEEIRPPYRSGFSNYNIIDFAYVSDGLFTFLHRDGGEQSYIENPYYSGKKLLQAPVLNRMESIYSGNGGVWILYVLGKKSNGPVMKPCYWAIPIDAYKAVPEPTYLTQCVEAYDLIVQ